MGHLKEMSQWEEEVTEEERKCEWGEGRARARSDEGQKQCKNDFFSFMFQRIITTFLLS